MFMSYPGFELSKNKWGLTSAYSLSLSLHTGDSASLTTAGVETDPQGIPGHLVWGLSKQLGGSTPQPPTPVNSNTGHINFIIIVAKAVNLKYHRSNIARGSIVCMRGNGLPCTRNLAWLNRSLTTNQKSALRRRPCFPRCGPGSCGVRYPWVQPRYL
jgi:hypothetical protein